jgi:hypothetical protein
MMTDALQILQNAVGDVFHIGDALAKVDVVEAEEARLQLFLHFGHRPFGVDLLRLDFLDDLVGK